MWGYLLQGTLFVVRPVCLFPDLIIYFDSPLRSLPPAAMKYVVCFFLFLMVNTICGILMTLSFRYGQLLSFKITTFVKKLFWPLVIVAHLMAYVGVVYPLLAICSDENLVDGILSNSSHELAEQLLNSTSSKFTFIPINGIGRGVIYFTLFITVVYLSAMLAVFIHMKHLVNSKTNRVFSFTFQLQNMLLTAYAADTFISIAFVIVPFAAIIVAASSIHPPNPSFVAFIAISMITAYPVILCPTIVYFVKPYHRWIVYSIMRVLLKLPCTCGISEANLEPPHTAARKSIPRVCHNVINFAYIVPMAGGGGRFTEPAMPISELVLPVDRQPENVISVSETAT
uniref:Serpentine receptor class gamma n=1 Tax=Panagrellus redivivus TaxID=6233 RepID=A0A7E4UMG5_PANRE